MTKCDHKFFVIIFHFFDIVVALRKLFVVVVGFA